MSVLPARRAFARLPREQRVGDIIDAARTVFTEHGYENASMAAIAERAGVVEGTIYKYFENKRDLLNRVLSLWYEGMLADQAEQLAGISGTRNRLRFVIWRHLATIERNPALCRLFFREVRSDSDYQTSTLHDLNRGYTRFATQVLREGIANGELRADLPLRLVRDMIYGTIEHTTFDYLSGRGELVSEARADELADLILSGITSQQASATPADAVVERLEKVAARLEAASGQEPAP